jgi:hypothetical protein
MSYDIASATRRATFAALTFGSFFAAGVAHADPPVEHAHETPVSVAFDASGTNLGAGLGAEVRVDLDGLQLGVRAEGGWSRNVHLGGFAEHDSLGFGGRLLFAAPLARAGPLTMVGALSVGVHHERLTDGSQGPYGSGSRLLGRVALVGHVSLVSELTLRAGAALDFDTELDPSLAPAAFTNLLVGGLAWAIDPSVVLYTEIEIGSSFGFGGDNEKWTLRGIAGARFSLGGGGAWLVY